MVFKKGQSGNPGGGRSGAQKRQKQIRELLMHLSPKAVTNLEVMLGQPEHMAFATKEVLDRIYGKPAQALSLEGPDGEKITINLHLNKKQCPK